MPTCEVCGGSQFSLADGFYNCDECGTQSQDMREIVNDDLLHTKGATTSAHGVLTTESTRAERRRRRTERREAGRRLQLSSTQALGVLLQRWAAAVVAHGVPADVHASTQQLWAYYLTCVQGTRLPGPHCNCRILLGLLWLALTDTDARYRLSDVLRWARVGVVPYYTAANEMPEDVTTSWMKLQNSRVGRLSLTGVRTSVAHALHVMNAPAPRHPPLSVLLSRLLAELALPEQLATVVTNVARRAPALDQLMPEADVLALVLISLKLLFGLDDVTELKNSEVAEARNAAQPAGPRWFEFTKWLHYMRSCRAVSSEHHQPIAEEAGGLDPCRLEHRRRLYRYSRRDGALRHCVELPKAKAGRFSRLDFLQQTCTILGRPLAERSAGRAAAVDDDPPRPLPASLAEQADALQDARLDFLVDPQHALALNQLGLRVEVSVSSARFRLMACGDVPWVVREAGDVTLLDERPRSAGDMRHKVCKTLLTNRWLSPAGALQLFIACGEVWTSPYPLAWDAEDRYPVAAASWPQSFRYLVETMAGLLEMKAGHFAKHYFCLEGHVLRRGAGPYCYKEVDGVCTEEQ